MIINQISQKIFRLFLPGFIIVTAGLINPNPVYAADTSGDFAPTIAETPAVVNPTYSILLDPAAKVNYSVNAFEGAISFSLAPGDLKKATEFKITELDELIETPWRLNRLSKIYQFDFLESGSFAPAKPLDISLKYDKATANLKQVFYYDKSRDRWRPLVTTEPGKGLTVRFKFALPFARLAVFEYPGILTTGAGSWYKYKGGDFAASPDFPKGSKLRVYSLVPVKGKSKFVDVVVNDFGPDRERHPDRAIDLDRTAFKKIASLGQGTVKIRVEPLYIAPVGGRVLDVPPAGLPSVLALKAKSAVAIDGKTGTILWAKNATSSLPIASLSKLVAIKVFLDSRPSLDRVVAYRRADEEFNYQYAAPGEVARLKVKDGETMTAGDLLYAALVGSANNAVESLVRISGLKREDFIAKMNQLALDLGASSTSFVEPTGLAPQNVSSALDYAIIVNKILSHPIIEKASKLPVYRFATVNTKKKHVITNTNGLVLSGRYTITGSKTGYLDEAGYCLMTRARQGANKSVIVVTLGAPSKSDSLEDTGNLIDYSLKQL